MCRIVKSSRFKPVYNYFITIFDSFFKMKRFFDQNIRQIYFYTKWIIFENCGLFSSGAWLRIPLQSPIVMKTTAYSRQSNNFFICIRTMHKKNFKRRVSIFINRFENRFENIYFQIIYFHYKQNQTLDILNQ